MRMIPSVSSGTNASSAEVRIFGAFETMSASSHAVCFHSLRLAEHEYKREGELDFVVVAPQGLYVFEVKGGRVSRDAHGIWHFTNRFDRTFRKSEGPFAQARSGMYSLVDQVKAQFSQSELAGLTYGYGVIFPDCSFDIETVEWSSEIVLDWNGFRTDKDFERYVQRVILYWQQKSGNTGGMNIEVIDRIQGYLRPMFDKVPSLYQRAYDITRTMESLTEEQYEKLDAVEANDRILCSGGAGTGKTFLALEVARRAASNGKSVLIVCRGAVLAAYIRSQLDDPLIMIRHYAELKYEERGANSFDVLIVDEGQDLIGFEYLDTLDQYLTGGLVNGQWRIFYDANNQSGIYNAFDVDALNYLASLGAVKLHLKRNCRNTHEIVLQTKLMTLADLGSASAGRGLGVTYEYYTDLEQAALLLANYLTHLEQNDVKPGDIAILSLLPWEQSCVSLLPRRQQERIHKINSTSMSLLLEDRVVFSNVADFKGLERSFVIVVDFTSPDRDIRNFMSHLYVAMSRARTTLTLLIDKDLKPSIESLQLTNLEKLKGELNER